MHCVLFTANELNNTPNNSRRVGGEVAFFPGVLIGDVWLAAYFPTARWTCLPCPHRRSPYISVTTCFLHCRTLSPSMHAAQLLSSIVISHQHRAITCNDTSVINHGHVHAYMHTSKQNHPHLLCKSAWCNATVLSYKLNTRWCHAYAVDMTFFLAKQLCCLMYSIIFKF